MSRLTKEQKSVIVNKVLKKTFIDREETLAIGFKALGDCIWNALYSSHQVALSAVPGIFLTTSESVSVYFGGSTKWSYDHVPMNECRPVKRNSGAEASYDHDHIYAIKHRRLSGTKEQLDIDRKLLKRNLDSLFHSVNTRKQALAAWPECESFLPADVPTIKNLPALPTHDLNEMIARMAVQGGA